MTEYKSIGFSCSIIGNFTDIKCVEPEKRWVGGKYGWAVHRFPIKGGITKTEMMRRMLKDSIYDAQNTMMINLFSNQWSLSDDGTSGKDAGRGRV